MVTKETVATDVVDIASDVADLAVDVKDLTVGQAEKVVTVVKHNPRLAIVVGVVAFAAGGFAGFKYAERKLMTAFEARLEEEIEAERNSMERIAKLQDLARNSAMQKPAPEVKRPAKVIRDLAEARDILREQGYVGDAVLEETVVEHSVTLEGEPLDDDFDYAAELELRNPEQPYVITHDEFLEASPEFTQVTVVYYAGDDTLADEREEPVPDIDYTVGAVNLQRFGHGSRDSNIVYVRNEKLEMDFEIQRSLGKYAEEVMGYSEERAAEQLKNRIKHGDGG